MYKFLNRPISPHLSIYLVQKSSLSSIWHRFSAIILLSLFLLFLFNCKIVIWNYTHILILKSHLLLWKFNFYIVVEFLFLLSLSYHALSGVRHIIWDLSYLLGKTELTYSFYMIFICLIMFVATFISILYT